MNELESLQEQVRRVVARAEAAETKLEDEINKRGDLYDERSHVFITGPQAWVACPSCRTLIDVGSPERYDAGKCTGCSLSWRWETTTAGYVLGWQEHACGAVQRSLNTEEVIRDRQVTKWLADNIDSTVERVFSSAEVQSFADHISTASVYNLMYACLTKGWQMCAEPEKVGD